MLLAFILRLQMTLVTLAGSLRTRRLATSRGVTFIEYALLAAIAVVIAALFRNQLLSAFSGLFSRVKNGLNAS